MEEFPRRLQKKLVKRLDSNALRKISEPSDLADFSSNDYLGFAKSESIYSQTASILKQQNVFQNGATGSRLLSGNHKLYQQVELQLAQFHNATTGLIFNSGYDANIGFFSSVPQRGDIIIYDEFIHASIRDGIQMSNARSYKFKHNDLQDLKNQIERNSNNNDEQEIYVVTESVFSMDGDSPDLKGIISICNQYHSYLVVDEAHATGVFGKSGRGLLQELGVETEVFARIQTFGKALGCHGAIILGSEHLRSYLINFARSFIYTTGLPPHALATIQASYNELLITKEIQKLHQNITLFNQKLQETNLDHFFIKSNSAIRCCVLSGNQKVKRIASGLQKEGYDVKPILSPTVPEGRERLRFCLHSYNTEQEIKSVLSLLARYISDDDIHS